MYKSNLVVVTIETIYEQITIKTDNESVYMSTKSYCIETTMNMSYYINIKKIHIVMNWYHTIDASQELYWFF